ncbi:unnamed protein product [Closterium sp. Naga37s-1]|nr:unnamed protein product [Closterium sp. Naga37s-1]
MSLRISALPAFCCACGVEGAQGGRGPGQECVCGYVVTSSIEFNPPSLSSPSPSSHRSPTTSPTLQPSPSSPTQSSPTSPAASRASIRAFSATVLALVRRRSVKVGVGMDPLWGVHEHEWQVHDLTAFAFEAPFHFHSDRHTLVVEPQNHKEPE